MMSARATPNGAPKDGAVVSACIKVHDGRELCLAIVGGPTRREFVFLLSSTTSRRERVKTKNEKQTIIDFASRFPPRHFDASRLRGFEASLPRDLADFHNNHENMLPKHKTCCPNHVGYSKISPGCGRMHQDVSDRKSKLPVGSLLRVMGQSTSIAERIAHLWCRPSS